MNKPSGYDEVRATGSYTPPEVGGHYCIIKQVGETKNKTGKDMIVVLFDFCGPDQQMGYFMDEFNGDTRADKKWPFAGTKYIMVNDYADPKKTSRQFKTFCYMFEKSNNCEIKWDISDWGKQFKGKKIGVVYGQEESEWDGKIRMRTVPVYFCEFDKAKEVRIPETKYLQKSAPASPPPQKGNLDMDFMSIPEGADEEIPF